MIDWSKFGPPSSNPSAPPDTTTPIAPAAPGGIAPEPAPTPQPYDNQHGYHEVSQQQVDSMDLGTRIGRGIDNLGQTLFGRGNGSPLGGVPLLGDIVGAGGNVIHGIGSGVEGVAAKPFEIGASALSHIPLGWVPGGADDTFNKLGEWAKANNPTIFAQWQQVNAAATSDVLGGGNLKADFNIETSKWLDDQQHDSALGSSPNFALGKEGVGSVGGALSLAIQSALGLPQNLVAGALGSAGVFDPGKNSATFEQMQQQFNHPGSVVIGGQHLNVPDEAKAAFEDLKAGKITEQQARDRIAKSSAGGRNRVEEAAARLDAGLEVSDVEKNAVQAYRSGAWSMQHAEDDIIAKGQSITRNPIGQIAGTVATDPLTYITLGAGFVSKLGIETGARLADMGLTSASQGLSGYQRAALVVHEVQSDKAMGLVFRVARGMIDPMGVYKPSTVDRSLHSLLSAYAIKAFERTYGASAFGEARAIAREFDKVKETDSAIASFTQDQAKQYVAIKDQRDMFQNEHVGEEMQRGEIPVDPTVELHAANQGGRDPLTDLTGHMQSRAKNTFTAEEDKNLAGRAAAMFGNTIEHWQGRLKDASGDLKGILHAVTYKYAESAYTKALATVEKASAYDGKLPLHKMVLMNSDTLDDVTTTDIIDNIRSVLKLSEDDEPASIEAGTNEWNQQARRYPAMSALGYAPGGKKQLEALVNALEDKLKSGGITRRALDEELNHPALQPIRDFLDTNVDENGNPLWKIGFRPDEEVAWGTKRDPITGAPMIDRDPTISHVIDATPGRQPFSDTTRNFMGKIIGKSAAERANGPIDSLEAFINTMRDGVTGERLARNIALRYERIAFDAGIPKEISREIFRKASDIAGLERTTIRGISSNSVWSSIHDIIPIDFRLADGTTLDIHKVMGHLLEASEGDMRIMGASSVMSQRMRNALVRSGLDGGNRVGQMTVTTYNTLRYAQPIFMIQRITDAPYFSLLYGHLAVGRGELTGALKRTEEITNNMGRTGFARFFTMDMPEYAVRSNFGQGIRSQMQRLGLLGNKAQQLLDAPDAIIMHNQTNLLYHRWGDIVKGALDNMATVAEKADPELKAEMEAAGKELQNSFGEWRKIYSEQAGRVLDDNEVGLRYVEDMFNGWRRHVVNADGSLDFAKLKAEGERAMPSNIGDMGSIRPDLLAQEIGSGYGDAMALRRDVTGHMEMREGNLTHVDGEHDLPWLNQQLLKLGVHLDYRTRAMAYFSDTWGGFWSRLSMPVEKGGLDISAHYAKEAQDLIASMARDRGMDPWEYLSGVMASNLGPEDLATHMGRLAKFLQHGEAQPLEEWTKMFRSSLDVSAQETLLGEFEADLPRLIQQATDAGDTATAQALNKIAAGRQGGTAASGGAIKAEPEWTPTIGATENVPLKQLDRFMEIDRTVTPKGGARSVDLGALTEDIKKNGIQKPLTVEVDPHTGTALLTDGNHRLAAAKAAGLKDLPVVVKEAKRTPSELADLTVPPKGFKEPVSSAGAAYDEYFSSQFPKLVRERIASGVPHPNPEVEGYVQYFSKWVQSAMGNKARSRQELRSLTGAARDEAHAAPVALEPVPGRELPPEPGTAPLQPGMVRAYHYTGSADQLKSIRENGLTQSTAKGSTYGEPNQLWFSTSKPSTEKNFVEVHLDPKEITGSGGPPMHLVREPKPAAAAPTTASSDIIMQHEEEANALRDQVVSKWQDGARSRNSLHMEKDLHKLEQQGFDISEAEDHLSDYNGIERSEYSAEEYGSRDDATEAYQQDREDKWQEIVDAVEQADHNVPDHIQAAADAADNQAAYEAHNAIREGTDPQAEALAKWADETNKRGSNFAMVGKDLPPDRIVSHSEPWMHEYKALVNDATSDPVKFKEEFGWALEPSWNGTTTQEAIMKRMEDLQAAQPVTTKIASIPIHSATPYNRTHALIVQLLKDKIDSAQRDVFRLTEMQTKRSVLERSMNHPLFGLYPSSYMWGKVLPETVKFIGKNPYAADYVIADVQRAIAIQREYDHDMDKKVSAIDRSAGSFLLDYLTPGLLWSDHQARLSPLVRDVTKGDLNPADMLHDEFATMSPERWYKQITNAAAEIPGAVNELTKPQPTKTQDLGLGAITGGTGGSAPAAPAAPTEVQQITGPTKASALAPILADDLSRLQSILIHGIKPE